MRIIGVSVIKNESDILETFVRHNLGYLDALVVLENKSSDKSRQILERLALEGLPLIILDDPEIAHKQSEKLTGLIKKVAGIYNPDWIIPLDADEFLNPNEGETMESVLADLPEGSVGQMQWRTYVPTASDDSGEKDVVKRIKNRRAMEFCKYYKVIIPKSVFNEKPFIVNDGSHAVRSGDESYRFDHYIVNALSLAHFPVRSSDQVLTKALVGWLALLCHSDRAGSGWHWRNMYERFAQDLSVSADDLHDLAANYISDEKEESVELIEDMVTPQENYKLKYPDLMKSEPTRNILGMAEQLALSLKEAVIKKDMDRAEEYSGAKILSSVEHIRQQSLDVEPLRYIFHLLNPESILDVGFGGASLDKFREWGATDVKAIGLIDVNGDIRRPDTPSVENVEPSFDLGRKFDLVICSELINMIEPGRGQDLIKSLSRHAGQLILFTASQPGQPEQLGEGNVNLQTPDYWIDEWAKEGYRPLVFQTLALRMLSNFSWLKHNSLLLAPEDGAGSLKVFESFGLDELKRNNAVPKEWSPQKPGVYETTLMGKQADETLAQRPDQVLAEADRELKRILLKRARVNFDLGNIEESVSDTSVALAITLKLREPLEESVVEFLNSQALLAEERNDKKTISRIVSIMEKLRAAANEIAKKSP
ncbi:hypothetical protein MNBD_NITROSPINAE04-40 [hydrothermal vent metagenome]|uniref:Uncharacterized protein n=1 Tax=hydrothermal vent metagenome TaxID=652676 RepID=A0A3B1BBJ8_9ZZZZ